MSDDYAYRFEYADKSAFVVYPDGRAFITFPDGRPPEEKRGKIDNRIPSLIGQAAKPRQDEIDKLREQLVKANPAELLRRLDDKISTRLNNCLCEMKPGYDDSMVGFNEAWDIVRAVFKGEMAKLPLSDEKGTSLPPV